MYREYILNTGITGDDDNPTFSIQPPQVIYAFRVISVNFIQNWDSSNTTNNKIMFAEAGDSSPRTATIPTGTYHSSSITGAVAAALTAVGTQTYTCAYNEVTRRLIIATTGAKQFKILGGSRGSTSFLQLGIMKGSETGFGTSFTMANPLNLSASQPILLSSRTLQTGNGITYVSGINSDMNVLACISPDNYNDVVSWTNPSDKMFSTSGEISLNTIDIQLVDSATLQQLRTSAPIVVIIGVFDDPSDIV
ncbi:hypothetical protein DFS34DRAFT_652723 [Phlyctochytrium arcticum]|nr:hypothetical protein DFS34DRAFT_652723 [Phlyctochytrium arcticum]